MIKITLSSANLGAEADEAFFDAWAAYVAEHCAEACGVPDVEVDQQTFGDAGEDRVSGATSDERAAITTWLSVDGFEAFCTGEGNAAHEGEVDGREDVESVLNDQGRDVVIATLRPGHLGWDEAAINADAHRTAGVPDEHRATYYRAYASAARKRAEEVRDSEA